MEDNYVSFALLVTAEASFMKKAIYFRTSIA